MTALPGYACIRCGARFPADLAIDSRGCPTCYEEAPANLHLLRDDEGAGTYTSAAESMQVLPSMWRYVDRLPCTAADAVSLGEGLTPLVPAPAIGGSISVPHLLIKDEGRNPTWSHKDRFSSVAVSVARMRGARVVATASSGNAGASLAAYAARAGLHCIVATFAGASGPMLAQIRKTGATIVPFASKGDRWDFIAEGVKRQGWFAASPFRAPVVGSHPAGIAGYKTLAFEIVEQMHGMVPDWCVLPVCYGDALAGLWQGFGELYEERTITRLPRLVAAEVHGSLSTALAGEDDCVPDIEPKFEPLAVSIGATRSTFQALRALRQSRGLAVPVGNGELIAYQERLALKEGLFAELASVTPIAAIDALRKKHVIKAEHRVVAVVTASGLKDVDRSMRDNSEPPVFSSVAQAWAEFSCAARLGSQAESPSAHTTCD